jgi:uncharacterized membrane protein
MLSPDDRISLIERSLRCFAYGWLSLIPLVGLGFAILAVRTHLKARAVEGMEWNPAKVYLHLGFSLAWLGGLVSLMALALSMFILLNGMVP